MSTKTAITVLICFAILFGIIIYAGSPLSSPEPVACTADAKLCPDGSSVGRVGPKCEFAPCPVGASEGGAVVGAGEHCGGFMQNAPVCASGLHCEPAVSRPDTGGTCVANTPPVSGGGGILPYASGIRGRVLLGPTCPVVRDPPDPACADKPYQTSISVSRASDPSRVFASMSSAADGTFRIALPPGEYVVRAGGGTMLPRCADVTATVEAEGYVPVSISCDTGIR